MVALFPGITWSIEGDISKWSMDHDVLLAVLRKRIKDRKFIGLIESGLKRKGMDCKVITELGTLLSHIYLHELDRYMNRVMGVITRGEVRLGVETQRQLASKDPYRRVRFVRYADDFLIGVIGSKALALRLKECIKTFLKARLKINVNEKKTNITHHNKRKRIP